jgi:hypothetical protein
VLQVLARRAKAGLPEVRASHLYGVQGAAMSDRRSEIEQKVRDSRREYRTLKKYCEGLSAAVDLHIIEVDRIMKQREGFDRGKAMGAAVVRLEFALHQLQHFGMDMPFDKMRRQRRARELRAAKREG